MLRSPFFYLSIMDFWFGMTDSHKEKINWWPVVAVGFATFIVVTTEMLPIGLLTPIAEALGTTAGKAGLMVSLPAILAAFFAPLVVIASGGIDRRKILCGLLAMLVLANLASAMAVGIASMLLARILVGFCIGGIWAVAGGLAVRLVPAHAVGLAAAIIFGGVSAASVLGVPFGAWIGDYAGWRWAFVAVAALSALVLLMHLAVLPSLPVNTAIRLPQMVALLSNRALQAGLLLTLLIVSGHFLIFTFVRPMLNDISGFQASSTGMLLLAYGIAGIAGNFLVGLVAARNTVRTLNVIALGLSVVPVLFITMGGTELGGGLTLMLWGLAYGGVSVGLMTWIMQTTPRAIEVATALNVAVFNCAIALGSWLGGQMVDRAGLRENLWLAEGILVLALLLTVVMAVYFGKQWFVKAEPKRH